MSHTALLRCGAYNYRAIRPGPVWGCRRPYWSASSRIAWKPDKRSGPGEGRSEKLLLTKTQFLDQGVVALNIFLLEIGEQAATLVDHLQETTT